MKPYLDLIGQSGAAYRFRLAPDITALPGEGGNFVYVKGGASIEVIFCGVADTLHDAAKRWGEAATYHQAEAIYVRLNIIRVRRERDHHDLISGLSLPMA